MNRTKNVPVISYIVITIVGITILFRNFFGFDWTDESFYLSMTDRFYRGGIPFTQEWNPAQLLAIILLPLYTAYMKVAGTTEYIYLFFRMFFLLMSFIISLFTYNSLKKIGYSNIVAVLGSITFLLYSRASIPTLSYYSMSLIMYMAALLLICKTFYHKELSKKGNFVYYFMAGAFFSIAVCANPFLSIVYGLGIIAMILMISNSKIWVVRTIGALGGCFTMATFVIIYILSKASIVQILSNLKNVLNDPEHAKQNYLLEIPRWFNNIIKEYHYYTIGILTVVFLIIVYKKMIVRDLNSKTKKNLFYVISIVCMINLIQSIELIGMAYIAITIYGYLIYLLTEKRNKLVFNCFFIPGIILSIAWKYCSNTGITTMTIGFAITAIAAIAFISDFLMEIRESIEYNNSKFIKTAPFISFFLIYAALGLTFYLRIFHVHRDAPIENLSAKIDVGPAKGLYTTDERKRNYKEIIAALDIINEKSSIDDRIFISKLLPWGYVYSTPQVGALSTWRIPMDSPLAVKYYKQNPEMIPEVVFLVNDKYGVTNDNNSINGELARYLKLDKYDVIQLNCGTIFLK